MEKIKIESKEEKLRNLELRALKIQNMFSKFEKDSKEWNELYKEQKDIVGQIVRIKREMKVARESNVYGRV